MVPSLRVFALLADGERGALVGPTGEIAWLCIPYWDSEAIFSSLLGGSGVYEVTPEGRFVWGGYYESGTLIWRNRWVLGDGSILECRDALAFPGESESAVLLRRISPQKGRAKVRVRLDLWKAYGSKRLGNFKLEQGFWTADSDGLYARLTGGADATFTDESGLKMELELPAGQNHDLMLELSTKRLGPAPKHDELWRSTETSWMRSMPEELRCSGMRDIRHSYAVLRGLSSSSGGTVAAATTSLPERAESIRDYDYRYVWVRDQCWIGQAMAAIGPHPILGDSVRFVKERLLADGPQLQPVYTARGTQIPPPSRIEHLPGYPGTIKVVAGNVAGSQFQLDTFGEALLLFSAAARHDLLHADDWRAIDIAANAIEKRWKEKDSGVWELEERHWTHSRLMCAAGLRQIAKKGAPPSSAARWLALADSITAETGVTGIHWSGRWKRADDDDRVDASLMLPTLRGAVDIDDPRSLATLESIEKDLVQDGYCHRFRSKLPLGDSEGAFSVCSFWLALLHFQLGNKTRAAHLFERIRSSCGPPGLFTEEYDVAQREFRGNFPQAFVHAFLLECAVRMGEEYEYVEFES